MSSDSDSDSSGSGSSAATLTDSLATKPIKVEQETKRIPPIVERKLQLRQQLDMYQVDEDFEEEKYTLTG